MIHDTICAGTDKQHVGFKKYSFLTFHSHSWRVHWQHRRNSSSIPRRRLIQQLLSPYSWLIWPCSQNIILSSEQLRFPRSFIDVINLISAWWRDKSTFSLLSARAVVKKHSFFCCYYFCFSGTFLTHFEFKKRHFRKQVYESYFT